jgi:hypothetical protein
MNWGITNVQDIDCIDNELAISALSGFFELSSVIMPILLTHRKQQRLRICSLAFSAGRLCRE